VNSLGIAYENASAAESAIRDTDFAEETAQLTRSQILAAAATTVLAQANSRPQSALNLLQ
jgi:flagellin